MKNKSLFNHKIESNTKEHKEINKIEPSKTLYDRPLTRVRRKNEPVLSRLRKSDSFR